MAGQMTTRTFFNSQTKVVTKIYDRGMMEHPPLFPILFNSYEPDMVRGFQTYVPLAPLGTLQMRTESNTAVLDQALEGPPTTVIFATYALGYSYSKEASIEDAMNNLAKLPRMLVYSEQVTKDYIIWNNLNLGFNASVTLADGQPLFSSAHPLVKIPTQTYSNTGGTVALTPEALVAADIALLGLVNDAGLPAAVVPAYLVVPLALTKVAEEINASALAPYTSDNRVNVQQGKKEVIASFYLTSNTAFFVAGAKGELGMNSHSMAYSFKYQNDQNVWIDPATQSFNHTTEFRFWTATIDARGVWGSQGS